jgi:ubiquinone biosynthesis protein
VLHIFRNRIRHIQRYRDIVTVFTRYGFGFIMKEMGLLEWLSIPKRLFIERNKEIQNKTTGERVRLFLEELGPTFIKMGQLASTRPDVIPGEIIHELEQLQDHVPPFSTEEVHRIIEQELGVVTGDIFDQFSATPLAAASIGQVHSAVLKTGERVAVKIQRPDIKSIIETDLEVLHDLARLAEHRLEWASRYRLRDIVDEFSESLREELDYENEGRNSEKITSQFKNDPHIRVPKIYWKCSSQKVLTMEYVEGIKLNEIPALEQNGHDRKILAERVLNAIFEQIFMGGIFHGDPHPGNILALPEETIVFIDFGMVGRLTPEMKNHFASLVIGMMRQSSDEMIKAITNMGLLPDDINMPKLRMDVDLLKEKYYGVPFSQMSLGQAVNDLFSVAFRHSIRLPADLTLLGKTLLTIEGVVEKLDPELSIISVAEPFGRRMLKERLHPKNIAEMAREHIMEYGQILTGLPKDIKEFSSAMRKGKMKLEIVIPDLDLFFTKLKRISNQLSFSIVLLSFSIIMTGLIIGSSLGKETPTLLWDLPTIEIGFGIAAFMFLWLIYSIIKSGRF